MAISIGLSLPLVISEDGSIFLSSDGANKIQQNPDGTITGLTESAQEIINKYNLNFGLEIEFRIKDKLLQSILKQTNKDDMASHPITYFRSSLSQLAVLNRNSARLIKYTEGLFRRMIYSGAITAFETFFSDYIIRSCEENERVVFNLGEHYGEFRNAKYTLKELLTSEMTPKDLALSKLQELSFHNLNTIYSVYTAAFGIKIPSFGSLTDAILNRHDIVHRNGIKVGATHPTEHSYEEIVQLLLDIQQFVIDVISQIESSR